MRRRGSNLRQWLIHNLGPVHPPRYIFNPPYAELCMSEMIQTKDIQWVQFFLSSLDYLNTNKIRLQWHYNNDTNNVERLRAEDCGYLVRSDKEFATSVAIMRNMLANKQAPIELTNTWKCENLLPCVGQTRTSPFKKCWLSKVQVRNKDLTIY